MLRSKSLYRYVLFAVIVTTAICDAISDDVVLQTVSGREVPLSAVRSRLLKVSVNEASERLFELRGNFLESPGVRIDLHKETGNSVLLPDLPHTEKQFPKKTVTVDGIDITDNVGQAFIKRGKSVRVVHMKNGEIVAVFTNDMALTPLHVVDHPGIFINTARRNLAGSFEGDTIGGAENEESPDDDNDSESKEAFDMHKKGAGIGGPQTPITEHGATKAVRKSSGVLTHSSTKSAAWNACRKGNVIKLYEIAFASDSTLCKAYGNNPAKTRAAIEGMVDAANSPYRIQTCLFLYAKHIELNCNSAKDPYKKIRFQKTNQWIVTFAVYWDKYRKNIKRDVAVLVPGYTDGTATLGIAVVGKTCTRLGYAWVESLDDYVLAHELGHSLNCPHSQYGLMKATKGWFDVKLFASDSLKILYTFVDNKAACLKPFGYKRKTCAATFTTSRAFICDKSNWGYVYNTQKRSDRVNVIVEQVYDYFLVTLKASPGVRIYRVATAFVPYTWVYSSDLGPEKFYNNGAKQHSFKVKTSSVNFPYSTGTCCGNEMAVVMHIRFCNSGRCVDGFHGFWDYVSCGWCKNGKKLLPQGPNRKCAQCK